LITKYGKNILNNS